MANLMVSKTINRGSTPLHRAIWSHSLVVMTRACHARGRGSIPRVTAISGCSLMVERLPSKQIMWFRLPSSGPLWVYFSCGEIYIEMPTTVGRN